MKITSVFFKEAITWPETKYSGAVSFDIGKPGLISLTREDGGVFITVKAAAGERTTFIPDSNIRCINFTSLE